MFETGYLEHFKIMPYADTPFVKILTGIRRCGKSTILVRKKEDSTGSPLSFLQLASEIAAAAIVIATAKTGAVTTEE